MRFSDLCLKIVVTPLQLINITVEGTIKVGKKIVETFVPLIVTGGKTIVSAAKTVFLTSKVFGYLTGNPDHPYRYIPTALAVFSTGWTTWITNRSGNKKMFGASTNQEFSLEEVTDGEIDSTRYCLRGYWPKHGCIGTMIYMTALLSGSVSSIFVWLNSNNFSMHLFDFSNAALKEITPIDLGEYEITIAVEEALAITLASCAFFSYLSTDLKKILHHADKIASAFDDCEFPSCSIKMCTVFGLSTIGSIATGIFAWFSTHSTLTSKDFLLKDYVHTIDLSKFGLNFTIEEMLPLQSISSTSAFLSYVFSRPLALHQTLNHLLIKRKARLTPDDSEYNSEDEFIAVEFNVATQHQSSCYRIIRFGIDICCIIGNSITASASGFVSLANTAEDSLNLDKYHPGVITAGIINGVASGALDFGLNLVLFNDAEQEKLQEREQHQGYQLVVQDDIESNGNDIDATLDNRILIESESSETEMEDENNMQDGDSSDPYSADNIRAIEQGKPPGKAQQKLKIRRSMNSFASFTREEAKHVEESGEKEQENEHPHHDSDGLHRYARHSNGF